ncbi:MAG: tRNA (adenosine(37)-N6)-threonylcarbamoyltransferase complex ATPase subunit type 1 TsaE [Bacilli bacterium]|nr:tRNA (adenosine(37)-N6)-threonylcarbamoyltransferase complex ATPase subunit type 1 TsaE [Bacilli bacterium]MBQ6282459.1 tRNA (adenosine(37)-N6)-threonylcarbamoyltransferase complex ATPase subunit type 1 TsaE [Bacilli bacterium]
MDYKITTKSEEETMEIAENMESEKFPNMVICLIGDLGSGKTIFTKGFANSLGIDENITSPTFNIIKEYTGGEMNLYHMDLYRLNGDVRNLGLDEYFSKDGIVIIEWADMIEDYLPEERLEITFKIVDEDTRVLIFKPYGEKYEELCEAIL